ncbi:MAG: hypothetical protein K6B39_08990 [Lachnospiraceae bacterium]|nr:hypothetical protein [Lachnospiraceae bacterium]
MAYFGILQPFFRAEREYRTIRSRKRAKNDSRRVKRVEKYIQTGGKKDIGNGNPTGLYYARRTKASKNDKNAVIFASEWLFPTENALTTGKMRVIFNSRLPWVTSLLLFSFVILRA